MESFNPCEQFLFSGIIFSTVIDAIGLRIRFQLGTMLASLLPQLAAHIIKIGTMACKRPAIVKRPYHRSVIVFKKTEQNWIVQIMTMYIMEMDDIRIILLDFFQKSPGGSF